MGTSVRRAARGICGTARSPVSQSVETKREPTATVEVAMEHGHGSALLMRLLVIE